MAVEKTSSLVYAIACTIFGLLLLTASMLHLSIQHPSRLIVYGLIALLAALGDARIRSRLRIMPSAFVIVFLGIQELTLPENALLVCLAVLGVQFGSAGGIRNWVELLIEVGRANVGLWIAFELFHAVRPSQFSALFPAPLLLAAMVFFALDSVRALLDKRDWAQFPEFYRAQLYWLLPWYVAAAYGANLLMEAGRATGVYGPILALPLLLVCERFARFFCLFQDKEREHAEEMSALQLRSMESLALAIEAKDLTSHLHLRRVQVYVVEIGKELGLTVGELEALRVAAVLHDIGKLAIPDHILSKPGRLTPEEFEKIKIHPLVGAEILGPVSFPYPVAPIVRGHHEKWDGSGYPDGLAGEQIPIGARILAAVDCLDAIASDRPYRRGLPLDQAMEKIAQDSGRSFDPRVVEVLARRYQELEQQARDFDSTKTLTEFHIPRELPPSAGLERLAAVTLMGAGASPQYLQTIASARVESQLLGELADVIASLSLDDLMRTLAVRIPKLIPYDTLAVYLVRGNVLEPAYITGTSSHLLSWKPFGIGAGPSGWVAGNRKPILNGNASVEASYCPGPLTLRRLNAALAVPLEGQNGLVGVLTLYNSLRDSFSRDHLRILQSVALKVGPAIENAERYKSVKDSATTDFLTGVPNARSLSEHLAREIARARRENTTVGVVVCDLDGFKSVNDRFGHLKGNEVLRMVADGLQKTVRTSDYVARMGGDEFVVVMPGLEEQMFPSFAARFRMVAEEAGYSVCGEQFLSMSSGVAIFPQDGAEPDALIEAADRGMYVAKSETRAEESGDALLSQKASSSG